MSIPFAEEIEDIPAPVEALARLRGLPYPLLLESTERSPELGRFSFVAADPFRVLRGKDGRIELAGGAAPLPPGGDPFEALRAVLAEHPVETIPGLPPFQGGAAGYWGYDLCREIERLPEHRFDDLAMPDLCIGLYDWVLAWDHLRGRGWLISTGLPASGGEERRARAAARSAMVRARLAGGPAPSPPRPGGAPGGDAPARFPVPGVEGVSSTFSREGYLEAVERTREYIRAGDIFQVNLSQRLEAAVALDPLELYRRLRRHNPAPFAAYLGLGDAAVVSASPERFLSLRDGRVETRPIKGTAPRGATPERDAELAAALRASAKDRAENVMIVDLLRNDLSRVCRDDSVRVPALWTVESHPSVHHLVSVVEGEPRPGLGAADLLRAAFPGGSITGAPKIRAMEIIAELEPTRRGVYTGAIGYIGFDGTMDTSIAIRTLVVRDGRAYLQVGGGVVIGSNPVREYEETLHKARGVLAALGVTS